MTLRGIPVLRTAPSENLPSEGASQPIIQLKELTCDELRYSSWCAWCANERMKEARREPVARSGGLTRAPERRKASLR